jgi:hypothetical protein
MDDLEQRLARLERDNGRLKAVGGVLLAAIAAVFVMGQARPAREIQAQRFVVVNDDGTPVLLLTTNNDGLPWLSLLDKQGWVRADLAVSEGAGAWLRLRDAPAGSPHGGVPPPASEILLEVRPTGAPGIVLEDSLGRTRALMGIVGAPESQSPTLALLDEDQQSIWLAR